MSAWFLSQIFSKRDIDRLRTEIALPVNARKEWQGARLLGTSGQPDVSEGGGLAASGGAVILAGGKRRGNLRWEPLMGLGALTRLPVKILLPPWLTALYMDLHGQAS